MKASMNLENLKFPWNCSITSATAGESSEDVEFGSGKTPDGSKISDKYSELLKKAVSEMSGVELTKGSNNKMGKKMNLLIHPTIMKVSLMGQSSERDMMDMGKYSLFLIILNKYPSIIHQTSIAFYSFINQFHFSQNQENLQNKMITLVCGLQMMGLKKLLTTHTQRFQDISKLAR